MKHLKTTLFAVAILVSTWISPRAFAIATNNSDHIVVMISVDGLAAHYLDDPKADMPNIRALAAEGARAESMKASTPTVTWPNHTTLVTGVTPAEHGVLGNNFFDRATRKKVTLIWDPVLDKDQIVKVPTLYDVAKANGMKTAAIRWPASRNAKTLNWTMPDMKWGPAEKQYTTPSVVEECIQQGMSFDSAPPSEKEHDADCTRVFISILKEHRPQLALFHLIDTDHTQHSAGPNSPAAYEAIKGADAHIGEIWSELKKDFPGKATLVVVSDHGFSRIEKIVLPNVILRQAGVIKEKAKDNPVQIVSQAGSTMVYILDKKNRKALVKKVTDAFRDVKEVDSIVGPDHLKDLGMPDPKDDPHGPDMMIFAKEGFVFGDTAAGEIPFEIKPERAGSHGHNANFPDLHATFVAWGAGIKPGVKVGEIDNTRVAPTIAKLLKIEFPVKSKPLSEILAE